MLVGYARVSTQEQTLALQKDALKKAGCERIFTDTVSGAKWATQERVGLTEALEFIRPADTCRVEPRSVRSVAKASNRNGDRASRAGYRVQEPD